MSLNLASKFADAARRWSARQAVSDETESYTYSELLAGAQAVARRVRAVIGSSGGGFTASNFVLGGLTIGGADDAKLQFVDLFDNNGDALDDRDSCRVPVDCGLASSCPRGF